MGQVLDAIVQYVEQQSRVFGVGDITVIDERFDLNCPAGMVYVLPKEAIRLLPPWTNPPKLLFVLPDLIFRVKTDEDGKEVAEGMGKVAKEFAERVNTVSEKGS